MASEAGPRGMTRMGPAILKIMMTAPRSKRMMTLARQSRPETPPPPPEGRPQHRRDRGWRQSVRNFRPRPPSPGSAERGKAALVEKK